MDDISRSRRRQKTYRRGLAVAPRRTRTTFRTSTFSPSPMLHGVASVGLFGHSKGTHLLIPEVRTDERDSSIITCESARAKPVPNQSA